MRISRRVIAGGFIAIALTAMALVIHQQNSFHTRQVEGGFYTGRIPGIGSINLGFWSTESGLKGSLAGEGFGHAQGLVGTNLTGGVYHLSLIGWGEINWVTNAVLALMAVNGGRELDGEWRTNREEPPRHFRLTRCAAAREARESFSMRLGRYGHSRQFDCPYPAVEKNYPEFADFIEKAVSRQRDEFMDGKFSEVRTGIRCPSYVNAWEFSASCQIRRLGSNSCSIAMHTSPYKGGNGNWTGFVTANCWRSNGTVREFELSELFRPNSEWEPFLRLYCARDLHVQGASDYKGQDYGPVERELRLFTISLEGIQIYFNPYEVGSGAEGSFVVHIPFRELVGLLDTNGPARSLLAR